METTINQPILRFSNEIRSLTTPKRTKMLTLLTLSKPKRVLLITLLTLMILSVFLVATFVSSEVNWSPFDFIVGGTLIFSFGLLINYILLKTKERKSKIFLSVGVIVFFLIIWAELAVGIF